MRTLSGPRFMRLVNRLPAYKGVMRLRFEAEQAEKERAESGPSSPPQYDRAGSSGAPRRVEAVELRHSSEFAGLADWSSG